MLRESKKYETGLVAIMFVTWGVVFLDRMAQLYLMPYIAADLKLGDTQVGELALAVAVCWAVSALVFGAISDRVGRKIVLVPLTVVFSLLSGISGLVRTFGQLLGARALMGAAEGPCWTVMNALVEESSQPDRRGRNVGIIVSAAALIGLGVAPILTTQIAATYGWRAAFFVVGVPGLVMALLIARWVKEPPSRARPDAAGLHVGLLTLVRYRNIWLCSLAAAGFMTWLFLQNVFGPLYITRVAHQDPRTAGFLLGAAGLGSFVIGIVGAGLSDRFGRQRLLASVALLSVILPIALLVSGLYGHLWLLAAILFLTQGGQAIAALAIVLIPAESVPPGMIGAAIGFVTLVGEVVGGTVAPTVAGRIAETWGLQWPLWMAAAGAVVVFIAALFLEEGAPASASKGMPARSGS